MLPDHIEIVQRTWETVYPQKQAAADVFYDTLFEIDPPLRRLFPGDMEPQKKKLMHIINLAISSLLKFEEIRPALEAMGARHVGYGVSDDMYDTVGNALLKTLETFLAEDWTPEVREAWIDIYGALVHTMLKGASQDWSGGGSSQRVA